MNLLKSDYFNLIEIAIKEDINFGDITSNACIPKHKTSEAKLISKQKGVLCGINVFKDVFKTIDKNISVVSFFNDGKELKKNEEIAIIKGNTKSILKSERIALNFLQRMSGIATKTKKITKLIKSKTKVLDTRKTSPGYRMIDKYSVFTGGGINHRIGLFDMFMIKENHIKASGGIKEALQKIKTYKKQEKINSNLIVEVENIEQLKVVLSNGKGLVNRVLLDNFEMDKIKKAIEIINNQFEIEVSGNINENTISEISKTNVDYVSIGSLTHSFNSYDFSLLIN